MARLRQYLPPHTSRFDNLYDLHGPQSVFDAVCPPEYQAAVDAQRELVNGLPEPIQHKLASDKALIRGVGAVAGKAFDTTVGLADSKHAIPAAVGVVGVCAAALLLYARDRSALQEFSRG